MDNQTTVTINRSDLMDLLRKAALEGLRIGKNGTEGEYTDSGIAYNTLFEYLNDMPTPTVSVKRGDQEWESTWF